MTDDTFPKDTQGKAAYFLMAVAWLVLNATRLGILSGTIEELEELYGDLETPGSYCYIKNEYDNTPGRKPSLLCTQLKTASNALVTKLRAIYNDIPASKWTDADRKKLNRKTGLPHEPTVPKAPIKDECVIDLENRPNGLFKGGARTKTDTKKHNIPDTANALELRFAVVQGKFAIPPELVNLVKAKCMGPEDGTTKEISTAALFSVQVNPIVAGFDLYLWGRWIDIQHPERAGEWSERHVLMVN